MLELLLTRPEERDRLITAAQGLRFLVLDELHTYRGRQGADVAMLVRRLRDACHCILGNPPWERVKLQDNEFFATRRPEICRGSHRRHPAEDDP